MVLAKNAENVTYGKHAGDNFGAVLLGVDSLDADDYSEVVTSAINYDTSSNEGRIYIFSIT